MNINNHYQEFEDYCPECGERIISKSFERVCEGCGLIVNELLDVSNYSFRKTEDFNSSSKQYVALGNRADFIGGLGTYIGYENSKVLKDKTGNLLSPSEQKLFRRLKKNYGKFLKIKNHETEYRIFRILKKISLYLNLNKNVRGNAAYYYKKIKKREENVINNISLIAFCIFIAARKERFNAPITINEIADAFQKFGHRVNPRLILRDGLKYKNLLEIDSNPHKSEDYLIRLVNQVINHKNLESRLVKKKIPWSKNEYKIKLMNKCRYVLEKLSKWERGGRNPFILMGAIIYLSDKLLTKKGNLKAVLTQKMVSEATEIAEYSIRDHYVNLLKPQFIEKLNTEKKE